MRLVSADINSRFIPVFPFWEHWCILLSVRFRNLVTHAQRLQGLYSAYLMFWMRTHTGPRFIVSSEGRESHQSKVIGASHMNSKILVLNVVRTPNFTHLKRTLYHSLNTTNHHSFSYSPNYSIRSLTLTTILSINNFVQSHLLSVIF
jgi:hypothetical protein